ncbi:MAG: AraC family transcriptional regulator [Treponema sp.]
MIITERILNIDHNQHELTLHGTQEFPCTGYSLHLTNRLEDCIPWHWHDDMEIIRLTGGNMNIRIPDKTIRLEAGQSIFFNANTPHYGEADPAGEIESLVFHPLLITGTAGSVFARKYITPLIQCTAAACSVFSPEDNPEITENIITAFTAMQKEPYGYELTVRENLAHVCLSLCLKYSSTTAAGHTHESPDSVRIRKMLTFIHRNYQEDLSLNAIARSADISCRECLRCFRKMLKVSPGQYLIKYRILQSAGLLLHNQDMSIACIAETCGFNSASSFSQTFRRFFSAAPIEYRKSMQDRQPVSLLQHKSIKN